MILGRRPSWKDRRIDNDDGPLSTSTWPTAPAAALVKLTGRRVTEKGTDLFATRLDGILGPLVAEGNHVLFGDGDGADGSEEVWSGFLSLIPSSSVAVKAVPPARMATSPKIDLQLSPKPGALTRTSATWS